MSDVTQDNFRKSFIELLILQLIRVKKPNCMLFPSGIARELREHLGEHFVYQDAEVHSALFGLLDGVISVDENGCNFRLHHNPDSCIDLSKLMQFIRLDPPDPAENDTVKHQVEGTETAPDTAVS